MFRMRERRTRAGGRRGGRAAASGSCCCWWWRASRGSAGPRTTPSWPRRRRTRSRTSFPCRSRTTSTSGWGRQDDVQYILNIQPIVPFRLTDEWNLISRTIVPVIYQPELAPGSGETFGLGDIQQSLFLSPAKPGRSSGAPRGPSVPHGDRRRAGPRKMGSRSDRRCVDHSGTVGHRRAHQQRVVIRR